MEGRGAEAGWGTNERGAWLGWGSCDWFQAFETGWVNRRSEACRRLCL